MFGDFLYDFLHWIPPPRLRTPDQNWTVVVRTSLVVKNPPASTGNIRGMDLIPGLGRSLGGWNGSPLQDSCLENLMDRGAWWATVPRVAKSRTWLKQLSTHAHLLYERNLRSICSACQKLYIFKNLFAYYWHSFLSALWVLYFEIQIQDKDIQLLELWITKSVFLHSALSFICYSAPGSSGFCL